MKQPQPPLHMLKAHNATINTERARARYWIWRLTLLGMLGGTVNGMAIMLLLERGCS